MLKFPCIKMETVKDILNFFNAVVFYDHKSIGIIDQINRVRERRINNFHETIPVDRILITLSIIDVVILKIYDNDIENGFEEIHELRENVFYMLSFEKVIREEEANEK